jgi:outer membrane protein OmpA-like peptidoglycan-associated protein
MMVNLVTLIGKKNYYPVNAYLIGGVGLNYAWDNDEAFAHKDKLLLAYDDGRFSHNARIGAQVDCNISKHVSINLELVANTLKDHFNSKYHNKGDWQLVGQLGVTYKFAAKKSKQKTIKAMKLEPAEVWETRQDTIWYDDVVETPKGAKSSMTWTVFYDVRESDFKADKQLAEIGTFLKNWSDCKVDVKSYADVKTGNPQINLELSKERMEKAVKALIDAGVPASSITSNYYGDTIQPFAENDKNRVTIIIANGQREGKDKKMVKKFRTKEVRYRVR